MRIAAVAAGLFVLGACEPGSSTGGPDPFETEGWDPLWVEREEAVLELMNNKRAIGGRCGTDTFPPSGPLVMDPLLQSLARDYSRRMAEEQFFDHVAPDGTDPFERMVDAGFEGALPWGENLAAGYPTARDVFDGWMDSPGHCANILEPAYGAVGIGLYELQYDPMGAVYYWTQEFAGSPQP